MGTFYLQNLQAGCSTSPIRCALPLTFSPPRYTHTLFSIIFCFCTRHLTRSFCFRYSIQVTLVQHGAQLQCQALLMTSKLQLHP
jgi:hypothetical protein